MNDVGEPCAGEPHARFDAAAEGNPGPVGPGRAVPGSLPPTLHTIVAIVPDAEQGISYGVPAFKLQCKTIAGFAAFKSHLSYLPHSGSVIGQLAKETEGYTKTKGSLHFPIDEPLPEELVKKLLDVRMAEAFGPRR